MLLVDDEQLVRISTAEMLTDLGYEVVPANSAEAALAILGRGVRPDLLVTDNLMPGMTGAELARTDAVVEAGNAGDSHVRLYRGPAQHRALHPP